MITRSNEQQLTLREKMRGGNGTVQLTALLASLPANSRLFSVIRLTPGTSIGYHIHENETELFYFAEGCGRVCDDGEFFDVCAGDAMSTGSGHGHGVENTGDTDLVLVAAIVRD